MFKEMALNKLKESYIEESNNISQKINVLPIRTNKDILALNTHLSNKINIFSTTVIIGSTILNPFISLGLIITDTLNQLFAIDFCGLDKDTSYIDSSLFGEDVIAINNGEVVAVNDGISDTDKIDNKNLFGNFIVIKHKGYYSLYAHLKKNSIKVKEGNIVKQGKVIGKLGSSGNSTIPHLHFQICLINPEVSSKLSGLGLTSINCKFGGFYCQKLDGFIHGSIVMKSDKMLKNVISNVDKNKLEYVKDDYIATIAYIKTVNTIKESNNIKDIKSIINKIKNKVNSDKKEPIGNQNCMLCTWCLEAQLRGIDILPRPIYNPKDIVFNFEGDSIVKNRKRLKIKNKNEVINILKAENGSRFYVHVNWKNSNSGHEFMVMNIDNEIYVIDAQDGTFASIDSDKGSYYFKNINYNNSFLVRLDNRELNTDILKYNNDLYILDWNDDDYMSEAVINSRDNINSKFLEKNDTCVNLENWQPNGYNIIYITGLSGSGKTTLGIDLRKEFNCKRIELDYIAAYYMRKAIETNRKEKIYNYVKDECPEAVEFFDKNKNKYIIDSWSECIPIINDFLNWFVSKFSSNGQLYIINGAQIPDVYDVEYFKERPIIIKDSNVLKSFIRRTGREVHGDDAIQKFKSFTHHIKMITRPSYIKSSIKMTKYARTINNESVIYEASSMDKKYRCPYCDTLYKRKDLPSHIEDKHEDLIPKDMTPLQITFNTVNNKTHGTCTECKGESPWNEDKGRYDRICSKKSCHDSYVKKMKSRMINVYGREHNLNDAKVQEKMLKNRKISGTYVWSDRTQFSYCGSYEKSLLEFLDKVLCCKSEDIMTPGPVVDYTYKGEQHQWITDLYYIPYNLCFDVKDGGKNPNNRPMEEYRQKQDAKERAIKEQGKYNYIRLTDNDFSQLFEIFFELKMQLVDNDTNKIVRINEYSSATINALPVMGQEKGDYIIQYMDKNTFTRGYGYCSSNELIDDIHIIDIYGKENIVQRDEFINMVENYTIFKYNGDIVEETNEYDNTYPIDYYYTKLTGRRLIDDRQIFIDKDFTIESKLEDKLEALKEVYTSSLLNDTNILESDIGFDKDGMYMYNKEVGLRTKSYNSLEEINKDEIKIIGL